MLTPYRSDISHYTYVGRYVLTPYRSDISHYIYVGRYALTSCKSPSSLWAPSDLRTKWIWLRGRPCQSWLRTSRDDLEHLFYTQPTVKHNTQFLSQLSLLSCVGISFWAEGELHPHLIHGSLGSPNPSPKTASLSPQPLFSESTLIINGPTDCQKEQTQMSYPWGPKMSLIILVDIPYQPPALSL